MNTLLQSCAGRIECEKDHSDEEDHMPKIEKLTLKQPETLSRKVGNLIISVPVSKHCECKDCKGDKPATLKYVHEDYSSSEEEVTSPPRPTAPGTLDELEDQEEESSGEYESEAEEY